MVAAVVAVSYFAPQLGALFLKGIGVTAVAGSLTASLATALAATALSAAAAFGLKALGLTPKVGGVSRTDASPTVFRQSITQSFIVYGRRRVGGLLVFFHGRKAGGKHYRYFVIACAGHRCAGNPAWMLGDETVTVDGTGKVTSGKYANAAWLWFQRGLASETANATFVAESGGKWTAAHKGNGIAAIYAKFEMTEAVVQAGMPNITAVIDGRDEVSDPRTGTTGYSNNASMVFYDWLKMPREEGGFGAYPDEIPDDDLLSAWANVCDEDVSLDTGGTEKRYALDGVIVTGAAPSEIREALVVNCAGSFTYSGGKFLMRPGYYVPPSETLSEDDLAGPIKVSAFLTGDITANLVEGSYVDPATGYQGQPFAAQTLPGITNVRQIDLELGFITSKTRAERVARIALKRAEAEKSVSWPMNIMGLKVQALDTVQLGTARYGLSNYAWTVSSWGMSADFGVALQLREESPDIYGEPVQVAPPVVPVIEPAEPVYNPVTGGGAAAASNTIPIGIGTFGPITLFLAEGQTITGTAEVAISSGSTSGTCTVKITVTPLGGSATEIATDTQLYAPGEPARPAATGTFTNVGAARFHEVRAVVTRTGTGTVDAAESRLTVA